MMRVQLTCAKRGIPENFSVIEDDRGALFWCDYCACVFSVSRQRARAVIAGEFNTCLAVRCEDSCMV